MSELERRLLKFDPEAFLETMKYDVKKKLEESSAKGIIVELDDDISKAVTAIIGARAVGREKVMAIHISLGRRSVRRLRNVNQIASMARLTLIVVDASTVKQSVLSSIPRVGGTKRDRERAKTATNKLEKWISSMILNYYAEYHDFLVCRPINKSEILLGGLKRTGYLEGDLFPLSHVYQTHVGLIAKHLRVKSHTTDRSSLRGMKLCQEIPPQLIDSVLLGIESGWSDEEILKDLGGGVSPHVVSELRKLVERNKKHLYV